VKKIGILVGSLRKGSYSKKLGKYLGSLLPDGYESTMVDLSQLEMYNQDLDDEGTPTKAWTAFRKEIAELDGIIFVTPEYNRSVPALLKNALDVGSRPFGHNVWNGKPALIVSASPGALSAFGANHHLRQSLVFLNMPTVQQPEVYLSSVHELFDESGNITKEDTAKFLKSAIDSYVAFAEKNWA
jgi:chromate reductase